MAKRPSEAKPATKSTPAKPEQPDSVNELLASAKDLYAKAKQAEATLLADRIAIGHILLQLKELVGHGNFINSVVEWENQKLLNFGLKTAERAMAYAELDAQGKFDCVSNLTEAEGIRKAENAMAKAQSKGAGDNATGDGTSPNQPIKLTMAKAKQKAQALSKSALEECHNFEAESKRLVIEELIEILTNELESCTAQ